MKNLSRQLWVIYPFTPSAIGVNEDYVIRSNTTNSLFTSLRKLQKEKPIDINAIYITDKRQYFHQDVEGVDYRFFPATWNPENNQTSFGRQWSLKMIIEIVRKRPTLIFLFISGGWFAIFISLICWIFSVHYCPIIAGWGVSTRRSQKWYYKHALCVIVHTNAHKKLFSDKGIDTGNFMVMPMGVNTDLFLPKDAGSYGFDHRPVRFLHAGRIEPGKNLLGALHVFNSIQLKFTDSQIDIIGPATNLEYYQQVISYIKKNNLQDKVYFHGFIPNEKMPEFYTTADMLLFPTLSESFGFVIAESMACGTPVAALSGRGSPDEIIQDGLNGILAKDETELATKILEVLHSPEKLKRMGQDARLKVESNYSVNRTYIQIKELLCKAENKHLR